MDPFNIKALIQETEPMQDTLLRDYSFCSVEGGGEQNI